MGTQVVADLADGNRLVLDKANGTFSLFKTRQNEAQKVGLVKADLCLLFNLRKSVLKSNGNTGGRRSSGWLQIGA